MQHCGERFAINRRGRPQLYCRPSHRVRGPRETAEAEGKLTSEKQVRLLTEYLIEVWRGSVGDIVGCLGIGKKWGLPPPYERALGKVRDASRNWHRGLRRAALSSRWN